MLMSGLPEPFVPCHAELFKWFRYVTRRHRDAGRTLHNTALAAGRSFQSERKSPNKKKLAQSAEESFRTKEMPRETDQGDILSAPRSAEGRDGPKTGRPSFKQSQPVISHNQRSRARTVALGIDLGHLLGSSVNPLFLLRE